MILDIFSRQAVGWMVADCESASLANKLIRESCDKQRIDRDQLILHADRGSSMKSKAVALLLSDLGVTKSHSRPYVSDDNPFSEAQFKTLKYRPASGTFRFDPRRQDVLPNVRPRRSWRQKTWMAVAFSQKVGSASMTVGRVCGKIRLGR